MATIVTYNGVTLHNVLTRQWEQDVLYDASHTDKIGSRYRLAFEGIIHVQDYVSGSSYVDVGSSIATDINAHLRNIQAKLSEPRRSLSVMFGSTSALSAIPADADGRDGHMDMMNGPQPTHVNLIQIVSNKVYRVSFAIECSLVTVGDSSSRSAPVLSNRWGVTEEMDSNHYTTRTISGELILATSLANGQYWRGVCIPGREKGFKRERMRFSVDPSGLRVQYEIVDRQIHTAAPWPAADMEVTHSDTTNDGVTWGSAVNVRLTGSPGADPRLLITRAVQIADARLELVKKLTAVGGNDATALIESATITQHIGKENIVELAYAIKNVPNEYEFNTSLDASKIGLPLKLPALRGKGKRGGNVHYDPKVSTTPALYGEDSHGGTRSPAALALLQCYLQTPANDTHWIVQPPPDKKKTKGQDQSENDLPSQVEQVSPGALQTGKFQGFDEKHFKAIYTYVRAETEYVTTYTGAQLPIAANPDDSDESRDTAVYVTLARPVAQRIIRIDAERVGEWPELPFPVTHYIDGTIRGRLMEWKITPVAPTNTPDARKRIYRSIGYYRYALSRPPSPKETIKLTRMPWSDFKNANATKLPLKKILKGAV